jgi:hypothetical protein
MQNQRFWMTVVIVLGAVIVAGIIALVAIPTPH